MPASEVPRHEASVVDEFLAAPPTPEPQIQETPAPDVVEPPSELFVFDDPVNAIENLPAAEEMRQSALGRPPQDFQGSEAAHNLTAEEWGVFPPVASADPETKAVDALLDQATAEILASNPPDAAAMDVESSPRAAATFESVEVSLESRDTTAMPASGGDEQNLSPLAQTLANMAETMQGALALDPAIDLDDVSDGPLVPLPVDALVDEPPHTPTARPTPPPIPTGVSVSDDSSTASDQGVRLPVATLARLPEALAERPR
ncbi:MAG: hypothetical protein H7X95_00435, partial [Deltaproteobacteria bacterium]|nr:hypothetical protein [Deltaproteobacteria bacterium]